MLIRLVIVCDRHAKLGRRLPIDANRELRLRRVVVGSRTSEGRQLFKFADELDRRVGELVVARADDGKAQTLAAAAYAEAVGGLQRNPEPGDICEFFLQLSLDLLLRALAVGPGRQ